MYIGTMLVFFSIAASAAALFFLLKGAGGNSKASAGGIRLFYLSGAVIILTAVLLFAAFITDSFYFNYVYNYSSSDLPAAYKIAAFWAGQEGTFLLWALLLFIFGAIVRKNDEYGSIVLSVITVTQIFILIVLAVHSPFKYIWQALPDQFQPGIIPSDGAGLNPLLQDPWMITHPPVLFLGYASATIPFAYAIASLWLNDYKSMIRSYAWVLFSVTALGIGIFLGAYWAYKVLGWGGFWGWDPVENSSLIPWLFMLALVHGLIIQRRKGALVKTNLALSIISFVMIFYGTFLTRSGVLSDFSVHSFGDLGLSGYLIFFIVFYLVLGLSLLVKRFRNIESASLDEKLFTMDNIINFGIILLSCYALFVLFGTSMPILSGFFLPEPSSVTEKYYNLISVPFGVLILSAIAAAVIFSQAKKNIRNIIIISIASIAAGILLNIRNTGNPSAYVFTILAVHIIIHNIHDIIKHGYRITASRLSHTGVALMSIGIITSGMHSYSMQKELTKDIPADIYSVNLTFTGITQEEKSALLFRFTEGEKTGIIQTPYYITKKSGSLYREPYVSRGFFRDIYISPIEYKSGAENTGRIVLVKGGTKTVDGIKIDFNGFEIDRGSMSSGNAVLYAKLDVTMKGAAHSVMPGIRVMSSNEREQIDAVIPGSGRKISLLDFNLEDKEILLNIEPGKNSTPPDTVIVEVSFKRLIWLVWLGTAFISLGGCLAYIKARKTFVSG